MMIAQERGSIQGLEVNMTKCTKCVACITPGLAPGPKSPSTKSRVASAITSVAQKQQKGSMKYMFKIAMSRDGGPGSDGDGAQG